MSSPSDHPLRIELRLPSSHPELLEGLDIWLRLGLISDTQVKQICRDYLVCRIELQSQTVREPERVVATIRTPEKPLVAQLPEKPRKQPKEATQPNIATRMLQSLGEELSVRWLLFLGVFLVVISSGVLAASQWERFPASGQYGVLLAYTLSFWGFSFWAGRQNNLRLTAQTLLIVTLLLVPVNFWAMDSFRLWRNPLDWVTVAIAAPILTVVTVLLWRNRTVITNFPRGKLPLVNVLGLSYLHWGWKLPGFPIIAVYVAMITTTIITIYHSRRQPIPSTDEGEPSHKPIINIYAAVIVYALLLLLSRAIFVAGVEITQLGLAIGICGWLTTWLAQQGRQKQTSPVSPLPWEKLGGILLLIGWLVAVVEQPAQAIAVSGLILWVGGVRLYKYSWQGDLALIFVVGLQAIWLGWRLVPSGFQQLAIAVGTQLTQAQNEPWALISIALFPYIVFMVVLTETLHHYRKREVAQFGEFLTLLLGTCLTTIATVNPTLRSLNFLLSTTTLAVISKRRSPVPVPLVYLTHVGGLLTLCSIIDKLLPALDLHIWASIFLVLMLAEWVYSLGNGVWQRSGWYIGLGLAVVSFWLLWNNTQSIWTGGVDSQGHWNVIWLVTPIALTALASRTTDHHRTTNSLLSILTVGMAQLLTLPLPGTRLISLAVSTGVMYANSRYLPSPQVAGVTIGFGLSFIGALLWEVLPRFTFAGWCVAGAIATLSLWLGRTVLLRRNQELASIYADAADKWAIALCGLELLNLTRHSLVVYQGFEAPGILYLIATAITLGAITYRYWRQPTDWAFYGIGWCVELLIAEVLGFGERSIIRVAIANIALGLFTQLLGEWWRRRYQLTQLPNSFHILPVFYGLFSVLLRFNTFTDWSGLCSLGVALIFIGVGRRSQEFKPLRYLGIIGVSVSAYEMLFYQMSQASGGGLGDGLIAMAALGTTIMSAYRILNPWLRNYLLLSTQELKLIAHLHWAWSSALLMTAITLPIQVNRLVGLGTGVFLITYAILQGRTKPDEPVSRVFDRITTADLWVYLGFVLVAGMRVYWRETAVGQIITGVLVPWNGAIACVFAYFLYILPWQSWGWSQKPWRQAAYIVPLVILGETRLYVHPLTLLIAAGFYIFLAKVGENIRFTYISVALIDWALFSWLHQLRLTDNLWYVTVIGLSLLYIAQVDPELIQPESKLTRHSLRILGSGVICGWAILFHQNAPLIPGSFALIAIFTGLALRIRAFLYVGTATFLITSIYQLVILSLRYPFLKWVVGLLVGIALISIAANFETRRAQLNSILRNTTNQFDEWE
ncbi:conserved hypothetical protein [Trichormus variabilis ATCC 29413]|uniref:DUF2157 domain-containing protein n=2 Tax=Anabaena variabilis TaxID=264691 RepID=Q3M845_TRIV2|nr:MULTISPECIES: DUF2157 domain-containing protein [Nostocaceae]ABA22841.1 conserved hypothetical protein [Trichormus variabilis ATCC 29413]MBC1212955.1 DUF2157 domain-containing protein [Trichormus variabilis ARAD]MBC1257896.1 DUF2157 domain-containing protein [Trichormus variabilis V5]MBC1266375.1 DUF2157 domain-containing protein [Trichormus variabilis FSR]MBC1302586.1 DUF2157 domain-containing protein [Trichormus variabilis N2B]